MPMNGAHGCQSRAMESIMALLNLGLEVHLLSKNVKVHGEGVWKWSKEDAEYVKSEGISVLDVFDQPEKEEFVSPSWSKHIQQKIKSENYDFILVNYEHVLTPETYKKIAETTSVIDTHDDVHLSGLLQESLENLNSVDECRRFYAKKRLRGSNYTDQNIPKIYISKDELTRLGSVIDCFIPHTA